MSTPITDHTAGGGGEALVGAARQQAKNCIRGGNATSSTADMLRALADANVFWPLAGGMEPRHLRERASLLDAALKLIDFQPPAALAAHPTGPGEAEPVAREATLAVVRAAWALVDNTGHHDWLPLVVNRDDWNDLSARLDALKALIPPDELPADAPYAVAHFWPTNSAAPTPPAGNAGAEPARAEGAGDNCPAPSTEPKPGSSPLDTALSTPAEPPVSPAGGEDLEGLSARAWRPMSTAPKDGKTLIVARHRPNEHTPDGWVATITIDADDGEYRRGGLDTIKHYNGEALMHGFHGVWTGWLYPHEVAALLPAASRPAAGREGIAMEAFIAKSLHNTLGPQDDYDQAVIDWRKGRYPEDRELAFAVADRVLALLDASRGEPEGGR